eukprot:c18438_g1_i1 orf=423-1094(-)
MKSLFKSSPSQSGLSEPDDINELEEQDVWGDVIDKTDNTKPNSFNHAVDGIHNSTDAPRAFSSRKHSHGVEKAACSRSRFGYEKTRLSRGLCSISSLNHEVGALTLHGSHREVSPVVRSSTFRPIPQSNDASTVCGSPIAHQSAPVKVPDWPKILGSQLTSKGQHGHAEEEDDEGDICPPHLILARERARQQLATFSGAEGVLKGRELCKVRNAVWRQTGFME